MIRPSFLILLPATLLCGLSAHAQQPRVYLRTICTKVTPGAGREYEKAMEAITKMNQHRIKQSKLLRYVFASNAMLGEQSTCDYLAAYVYNGPPPEATIETTTADMAAAGAGSYDAFLAKTRALGSKRVNTEIYIALATIGETKAGNYFSLNQMKVRDFAEWNKLETEVWKPIMEERIKGGNLAAWRSYNRVMPSGANHPYNAVTVDVHPAWADIFKPAGVAAAFKKVHPNMSTDEFNNRTEKAREIVNREVYRVLVSIQ